jgi:recombination protein U
MGTWNTRGLRGSTLEDMINMTNDNYREKGLALIQKVPTPITPVRIDESTRHITLAYFEKQSTVDYIGVVQGIPICFDAKECAVSTFPMMNIHEHQIEFMRDFEKQGGIAFIILFFSHLNETYYIPFKDILKFYERSINGGRKSFTYDEINKEYLMKNAPGALIHYLEGIQKDLDERDEN